MVLKLALLNVEVAFAPDVGIFSGNSRDCGFEEGNELTGFGVPIMSFNRIDFQNANSGIFFSVFKKSVHGYIPILIDFVLVAAKHIRSENTQETIILGVGI